MTTGSGSPRTSVATVSGSTTSVVRRATPEDAAAALQALGFPTTVVEGQVAPTEDQEGLVYKINPKGNVKKGTTIELTIYKDIPEVIIPAPTAITQTEAGPFVAGDTVSFDFPTYTSCPVGQELTGYNFIFSNGASLASPVDATSTSGEVVLGATPGGNDISYTAICGGSFESPPSSIVTITGN